MSPYRIAELPKKPCLPFWCRWGFHRWELSSIGENPRTGEAFIWWKETCKRCLWRRQCWWDGSFKRPFKYEDIDEPNNKDV